MYTAMHILLMIFSKLVFYIALFLGSLHSYAAEVSDQDRQRLMENQRNIIQLRKERLTFQIDLRRLMRREQSPAIEAEITETKELIEIADVLISNVSTYVAEQRLKMSALSGDNSSSALDIALNKALNSNLPELLKNLSDSEGARKEILRLRKMLRQQARLKSKQSINNADTNISLAPDSKIAEEEFLRLLSLFSSGDVDEAADKIIRISGKKNGQPFIEYEILSHLGHDQYHLETTVYQGKMTFVVDRISWNLNINSDENETTYIVIYDSANKEKPRLVMFNKGLLSDSL